MGRATLLRTALAVTAAAVAGGLAADRGRPGTGPAHAALAASAAGLRPGLDAALPDLAVTSARALDGLADGRSRERSAYGAALAANLVLPDGTSCSSGPAGPGWPGGVRGPHRGAAARPPAQPSTAALPWHSPTRRGAVSRQPYDRDRPPELTPAQTSWGASRRFQAFVAPHWVRLPDVTHVPESGEPSDRQKRGSRKRG